MTERPKPKPDEKLIEGQHLQVNAGNPVEEEKKMRESWSVKPPSGFVKHEALQEVEPNSESKQKLAPIPPDHYAPAPRDSWQSPTNALKPYASNGSGGQSEDLQ